MLEIKFKKNIDAENMHVLSSKFGLVQKDCMRLLKNLTENGYAEINFDLKVEKVKDQQNYSEAKIILDFMNEKCGTKFRHSFEHLAKIQSRINETSINDCKIVIAKKAKQWKDCKIMSKYLRPATLFAKTNFENYLGEKVL